MAERFLVTGVLGCLGAWTARTLVARGRRGGRARPRHRPTSAARDHGRRTSSSRVALVQGDITRPSDLEPRLDDHEITHVIHLAALQIPFCRDDPALGAAVNVLGTVNVFEAVKQRRERIAGPLVYASSAALLRPRRRRARARARGRRSRTPSRTTASTSRRTRETRGSTGRTRACRPSASVPTTSTARRATRASRPSRRTRWRRPLGRRLPHRLRRPPDVQLHRRRRPRARRHEPLGLRGRGRVQHARLAGPHARGRGRRSRRPRPQSPARSRSTTVPLPLPPELAVGGLAEVVGPVERDAAGGRACARPSSTSGASRLRDRPALGRAARPPRPEPRRRDARPRRSAHGPPAPRPAALRVRASRSAGDLDETAWTARYRGGWQLALPNAGTACEVGGSDHGFHGRASNDPWQVRAARWRPLHARVEWPRPPCPAHASSWRAAR